MLNIIKRLRLWWAQTELTPEDHACLAWHGQGMNGALSRTYKVLMSRPRTTTEAIGIAALALAVRWRN